MTAIEGDFCNNNARSCAAVQDVLERSPGLIFINGEFRHKKSLVPPSPPPLPLSPPRNFAYAPLPPSPPPPPGTPPPYYKVRLLQFKPNSNSILYKHKRDSNTGRRELHSAAAPLRLRPRHYRRCRRWRRDGGARKLRFRQTRLGWIVHIEPLLLTQHTRSYA